MRTPNPTAGWEIARPARPSAPGAIAMAGFRIRGDGLSELRAIPHPAVTIVVDFGERPLTVSEAGGGSRSGSLVVGLGFRELRVRADLLEAVQVRLSPLAAREVLGVPLAELGGNVIALEDLWARDAGRLRERLHDAHTWQDRFDLIDSALSQRLRARRSIEPEVAWVWQQIMASHGLARITDLAERTGRSRQQLWSRFGRQIGLSPKRAAMLVRFDHAIHRLADGHPPARVAAVTGYADQAHLHRDIRAFTGATPAAAAAEPWLAADDTAWPTRMVTGVR
ncbi:AraC family transcriptional regulator [Nocardia acididurans]|uniref:AraC family transcriptional regulator n=1 Tax=Nocardia acididurans TaxID=2802282 RepID=UPI0027DE903E|nr:helix-turn-helix domain-containing protein [Nocardia acididurans]